MKFGNYQHPAWMKEQTHTTTDVTPAPIQQPASSSATPAASSTSQTPKYHSSPRDRVIKFFKPNHNPNEPRLRLKGPWDPSEPETTPDVKGKGKAKAQEKPSATSQGDLLPLPATDELSALWLLSEKRHNDDDLMVLTASAIKALEHERKELKNIPNDQRILPDNGEDHLGRVRNWVKPILTESYINKRNEKAHKKTYHGEEVNYLLRMLGENDTQDFLNSARKATGGAAHRHGATLLNATASVLGAVQQLDPEPISKAVLTAVRLILTSASAGKAMFSWNQKLQNSQSEELMVNVRFDDPPSAKIAPDMLRAAWEVVTELWTVKKTMNQLQMASDRVDAARASLQPDNPASVDALKAAERKKRFTQARLDHQIKVKSEYKTSSETGKVELIGSKKYIQITLANAGLTGVAGGVAIMTPIIGAPITGGISAGVAAVVIGGYFYYVLSSASEDDLEGKNTRPGIALAKSHDLLNDERVAIHRKRAEIHEEYVQTRAAIKRRILNPAERKKKIEMLKDAVDADLIELEEQEKNLKPAISQEQNWKNYRDFARKIQDLAPEEVDAAVKEYAEDHRSEFQTKVLDKACKDPVSMRVDNGRKLFAGKIGQAKKDFVKLDKARVLKDFLQMGIKPEDKEARQEEIRAELAQSLADSLNIEAAHNAVKHTAKQDIDDDTVLQNGLGECSRFLKAIKDQDFRTLFKGDGKAQILAGTKAKKFTAGEEDRQKWTAIGGVAVGAAITTAVGIADTGIAIAKALPADTPATAGHDGIAPNQNPDSQNSNSPSHPQQGRYHGLIFADYQMLRVGYPVGATLGSHNLSAVRHKLRDVEVKKFTKMIVKAAQKAISKEQALTKEAAEESKQPEVQDMSEAAVVTETANHSDTLKFTLDWPVPGETFEARDMAEIAEAILQHRNLPKNIEIKFRPSGEAGSSTSISLLRDVKLNLESTVPFRKILIKEASTKDRARFKLREAKIIGRQALVTVFGVPTQFLAQIPLELGPSLEEMKNARNGRPREIGVEPEELLSTDFPDLIDGDGELVPMKTIASSSTATKLSTVTEAKRIAKSTDTDTSSKVQKTATPEKTKPDNLQQSSTALKEAGSVVEESSEAFPISEGEKNITPPQRSASTRVASSSRSVKSVANTNIPKATSSINPVAASSSVSDPQSVMKRLEELPSLEDLPSLSEQWVSSLDQLPSLAQLSSLVQLPSPPSAPPIAPANEQSVAEEKSKKMVADGA